MRTSDRFWSRVELALDGSACLVWHGARGESGYGQFRLAGRNVAAHRWAWEEFRGPVPVGLVLDHLCRNRACVNPDHLEPVTQAENIRRGDAPAARNARKARCIRGHRLASAVGRRRCPVCDQAAKRRSKLRCRSITIVARPDSTPADVAAARAIAVAQHDALLAEFGMAA